MTTITVHRTAIVPDSTLSRDFKVTLCNLPQTWSWSNVMGLSTSLSGEKGDYSWNYNTPTATLSISTKKSYQQRFYGKQADVNNLTRRIATLEENLVGTARLEESLINRIATLEDKLVKRDQDDDYFSEVIMKVQIYTSLGRSLHNIWFRKLPQYIQEGLINAELHNLPRCFMVWWFFWSEVDPVQFSMPRVVSDLFQHYVTTYAPLADDEDSRIRALLVDVNDRQTELGNLLEEAWVRIADTDRLLMLVCWAARQEDHHIRNKFAHPVISRADATSIISGDIGLQAGSSIADTTRTNLLTRALAIIPQIFV